MRRCKIMGIAAPIVAIVDDCCHVRNTMTPVLAFLCIVLNVYHFKRRSVCTLLIHRLMSDHHYLIVPVTLQPLSRAPEIPATLRSAGISLTLSSRSVQRRVSRLSISRRRIRSQNFKQRTISGLRKVECGRRRLRRSVQYIGFLGLQVTQICLGSLCD